MKHLLWDLIFTTFKVYGRIDGKLNETKTIVFLGLFTDPKTEKLSNS